MNMNVTSYDVTSYDSVVLLSDQIFKQSITQLHESDKWLTKLTQSVSSKAMFEVPSFRTHTSSKSSTLNSHRGLSTVDCSRPHQTSISRCFSSSMVWIFVL